jgi:hypothetical protein
LLPLLLADGDAAVEAVLVEAVEVEAAAVLDGLEEIVVDALDNAASPAPSCWKTKDVPFKDTLWVWETDVLVSSIENFEVNPAALAHFIPFVQSHDCEPVCVHVKLLWLRIELQFGPAHVNVIEKLKSASQNM